MRFVTNVDKERYEKFVKGSSKYHFLQSYAWGEFAKAEKNVMPLYVGMEDENGDLCATALILKKNLPFNKSYFYIPRGFILDYNNLSLIEEFTKMLKNYARENKAIFIKIDPDLIYHEEDKDGNVIVDNNDKIVTFFKKLGYKHLGFTKNFETMQPRYTFRINYDKPFEEIYENFSKTTKQRIKKAEDLDVSVEIGDSNCISDFYNLMVLTENRKDFITHNKQYYRSLYDIWNKDNSCNIFLGSIDLNKVLNKTNNRINAINEELSLLPKGELSKSQKSKKNELEKQLDKLKNDIIKYTTDKEKYGDTIILSAHFIIEYGNMAWVLYAGNHNILSETYTNYETYLNHIKYYYDKGIKVYDQFGTIGDLRDDNPLLGLHEFKKKFGGNYVEFTGEFDLVTNKLMYFVFTKLVPLYRKTVKKNAKKKRGK